MTLPLGARLAFELKVPPFTARLCCDILAGSLLICDLSATERLLFVTVEVSFTIRGKSGPRRYCAGIFSSSILTI